MRYATWMGAEPDPDALGNTATDVGAASRVATPSPDQVIGRYRIERELGAGGMGVVYAAFDPDLERRVALKVITDGKTLDLHARTRLLSEARAMARLNHPNVVTVFEVGSAGGRDYVAMELVDGTTLAEWLRTAKPSRREIIAAFIDAGRGLAAAHDAGLIHRDFKPHNVLRRRDGCVQVTDFGLARDTETSSEPTSRDTPSPVGGSTETGSILGTPAYMAPEQWLGTEVGPAADQFAFCIALWEALAGERPYGTTEVVPPTSATVPAAAIKARKTTPVEDMRVAIINRTLDASAIPRPLRWTLLRGLEPAPERRWPSIAVLLRRLELVQRLKGLVIVGAAIVAATIAVSLGVAVMPRETSELLAHLDRVVAPGGAGSCRAPSLDVDVVWSTARAAMLIGKQQGPTVRALDHDVATWRSVRAEACKQDPEQRVPRLACLDGMLAWIDETARLADRVPIPHVDLTRVLTDPNLCALPSPPRLMTRVSPQLDEVLMRVFGEPVNPEVFTRAVADKLIAHVAADPCAAAVAHNYASGLELLVARNAELEEAANLAEVCDDDRVRFIVALKQATWESQDKLGDPKRVALKRAEASLLRVPDPGNVAEVDRLRMLQERDANHLDAAIALAQRMMAEFRSRDRIIAMLETGSDLTSLLELQGRPDALAASARTFEELSPVASAYLGADDEHVAQIDWIRASALYRSGDLAAAHAIFDRLRRPTPLSHPRHLTGRVVDDHEQPVVGALVTSGCCLEGDALGAAITMSEKPGALRTAKTDANGHFDLPESASEGTIIAELGTRRSRPIEIHDDVELVIEPTSRIAGHVELHGRPAYNARISATDASQPGLLGLYSTIAPVLPDGSFVLDGIRHGDIRVSATVSAAATESLEYAMILHVHEPLVGGVAVDFPISHRTVHVVVRSTIGESIPRALVSVFARRMASTTLADPNATLGRLNTLWAHSMEGERIPPGVLSRAHPGDLFATDSDAPAGEASACAFAFLTDLSDRKQGLQVLEHLDRIAMPCVPIGPADEVVVVELPPFPRFD